MGNRIGGKLLQEEREGPEGWDVAPPEELFWNGLELWLDGFEGEEV